jgi:glycosyltransferase involved in cell wall biosynthesis
MSRQIVENPTISIITPVFNGSKYLEEHIQSVLHQDYPYVEHIIIDDGSNDNGKTIDILRRYPHLKWYSRENKGQYPTINEGLLNATGHIVGIISADDNYALPSTFSSVAKSWRENSTADCFYGMTRRIDDKGTLLQADSSAPLEPFPMWRFKYSLPLLHCSMFVDRHSILANDLFFDTNFKYAGDWDWIIRLSKTVNFIFINQVFSYYREHNQQTTIKIGQNQLNSEVNMVLKKHRSNFLLYWSFKQVHRINKAIHTLSVSGIFGLWKAFGKWIYLQKSKP